MQLRSIEPDPKEGPARFMDAPKVPAHTGIAALTYRHENTPFGARHQLVLRVFGLRNHGLLAT